MLKIKKKRHGINIIDCWYAEEPIRDKGVVRYMEAMFPVQGREKRTVRTLLSDLTENEEEILHHFSKNCLYKVKRAPREGVTCKFYGPEEILSGDIIEKFGDFFEEFWKSKSVDYQDKQKCMDEIRLYAKNNAVVIATASVGEKVVVYHVDVMDDKTARLLHSASQFRIDEEIPQTVVGFANRYLHKESLLFFKKMGKQNYDWGGAGQNDEVASITAFKESFGGAEKFFYNGQVANGVSAKIYEWIIAILNKF